ncbi:hypothetical protein D9M68_745960 [compost metagenome]
MPSGKRVLIWTKHSNEHLIQVGTLSIHTDRQAYRGKHTVGGLNLSEDRSKTFSNLYRTVGLEIFTTTDPFGHAFQQGRQLYTRIILEDIDRIGDDILLTRRRTYVSLIEKPSHLIRITHIRTGGCVYLASIPPHITQQSLTNKSIAVLLCG